MASNYRDYVLARIPNTMEVALYEAPAWTIEIGDEVITEGGERLMVVSCETYDVDSPKLEQLKKAVGQPGNLARIAAKATYKEFKYDDEEASDDTV